jgi:hypothetical protein
MQHDQYPKWVDMQLCHGGCLPAPVATCFHSTLEQHLKHPRCQYSVSQAAHQHLTPYVTGAPSQPNVVQVLLRFLRLNFFLVLCCDPCQLLSRIHNHPASIECYQQIPFSSTCTLNQPVRMCDMLLQQHTPAVFSKFHTAALMSSLSVLIDYLPVQAASTCGDTLDPCRRVAHESHLPAHAAVTMDGVD